MASPWTHENSLLTAEFSESEIKEVIFPMKHNKAPSPNGFPAEFYQQFRETIKGDLLQMFRDLSRGDLPLFSLNFGVITPIPKVHEANLIQQYRPICLLNVSYKIFTKVTTKVKENRLVFEKAYDKVRWPFLLQTLRMKGFSSKWISWIKTFISSDSVAVNVNDDVGHYFQTKKGLQQADPLSPLLFNIMVDMLKVFISRAKLDEQLEGVIPHLVDGGLSTLQYADDTILFMDHDLVKPHNMKLLLSVFEQASGLKINSTRVNFEERFEKRLSSWKVKHLSIGGRLTLINSVLSSLLMYMISFFSIPKGVLMKLDYNRSRFFWQRMKTRRNTGLLNGLFCVNQKTKEALLYKLLTSDGTWQQILGNKYIGSKPLAQVEWKIGDSHFWSCLMKVKPDFLCFRTFLVKDGSQVRFWEDIWLDGALLKDQYPSLYNIARPKSITIAEAMSSFPPSISWRRQLYGTNLDNWTSLLSRFEGLELSYERCFLLEPHPKWEVFITNALRRLNAYGLVLGSLNLWKRLSYPFGDTLAFELGCPPAGGGLAFGCSRVVALGAGGHD
ncbi:hypothetical protein U9M48_035635, partial [Paspalum notatum var. saurae]